MSPAIRDGRNGVTVDTNEPRLPAGAGPVERRFVSPLQMADIAAERAAAERQEKRVQIADAAPKSRTGQKRSPETRERMRLAQLARYATVRAANALQDTPPARGARLAHGRAEHV